MENTYRTPARGPIGTSPSPLHRFAPLVPYLSVFVGLYLLHNAWVALLMYHGGMAVVLTVERQWGRVRDMWRPGGMVILLAPAIGLGVAGGAILYGCWPMMGASPHIADTLADIGLPRAIWPAFLPYFCVVNACLEELFWRGYLGSDDRRPVWHDLWFAGYHLPVLAYFVAWPWLLPALAGIALAGWVWRQADRLTGSQRLAVVSHIVADLGIVLAVVGRVFG